jgi:hypothetical protein
MDGFCALERSMAWRGGVVAYVLAYVLAYEGNGALACLVPVVTFFCLCLSCHVSSVFYLSHPCRLQRIGGLSAVVDFVILQQSARQPNTGRMHQQYSDRYI